MSILVLVERGKDGEKRIIYSSTPLSKSQSSPSSRARFGDAFEDLKASTSVVPFLAVLDGRQSLPWREFVRPAQLGIVIAVGVFWWAHRFIATAALSVRNSALESLLG